MAGSDPRKNRPDTPHVTSTPRKDVAEGEFADDFIFTPVEPSDLSRQRWSFEGSPETSSGGPSTSKAGMFCPHEVSEGAPGPSREIEWCIPSDNSSDSSSRNTDESEESSEEESPTHEENLAAWRAERARRYAARMAALEESDSDLEWKPSSLPPKRGPGDSPVTIPLIRMRGPRRLFEDRPGTSYSGNAAEAPAELENQPDDEELEEQRAQYRTPPRVRSPEPRSSDDESKDGKRQLKGGRHRGSTRYLPGRQLSDREYCDDINNVWNRSAVVSRNRKRKHEASSKEYLRNTATRGKTRRY